jgi:hypothetical protein
MKALVAMASFVSFAPLVGCVSAVAVREIVYEQKDLPEQGAIEIRYRNQSRTKMCVAPGAWPNPIGAIADAEHEAFLIVGSQRFAMRPFNGGYCVKDCGAQVKPGEDLVTRIPYEFFDLPRDLFQQAPKHLDFTARAYPCRRN